MVTFRIDLKTDGNIYTAHVSSSNEREFLATSASLTTTYNKAGSLSFVISPKNVAYGHIKKLRTIAYVYWDDTLLWKGRVLETRKDFYNNVTVTCEGWLSVLMDSVVSPMGDRDNPPEFGLVALFQRLIGQHNTQVDEDDNHEKTFTFLHNQIPQVVAKFDVGNYETTLDYIQNNLIEEYGGRIWVDDQIVYWYGDDSESNPANQSYQSIIFGENLLDLSEHIDASNLYTVLVGTGSLAKEENTSGEV